MGNKIKNILNKIKLKRTTVLIGVFVLFAFIVIKQLFSLQILQGKDYISKFHTRTTKTRILKSTRGNIYDRNGVLLASNQLAFTVTLEDNGSYKSTREKNLAINGVAYRVLKILEKNKDIPFAKSHIEIGEDGNYAFDIQNGLNLDRFKADVYGHPYINELTKKEKKSSADDIINYLASDERFGLIMPKNEAYTKEELKENGLPEKLSKKDLLDLCNIRLALSSNSFKKYLPVTIATNVSQKSIASIMENLQSFKGIDVVEDSIRKYKNDNSLGPILGYTGKASTDELDELRKKDPKYSQDAIVGKAGIEKYEELYLHGTDGKETVYVDNLGKVLQIDKKSIVEPKVGDDVHLTIDANYQDVIYNILKQRLAGILLTKIDNSKFFDKDSIEDSKDIRIPIYDVYTALFTNRVIDISKFEKTNATPLEKSLFEKLKGKQKTVFDVLNNRLTAEDTPLKKDEPKEIQEYLNYIVNKLLIDKLGIISKDEIKYNDPKVKSWMEEGNTTIRDFLNYAASKNWIDINKISPKGEYLSSNEVYTFLSKYLLDYLKTDRDFSQLLYKYMLLDDEMSPTEACLVLYDQGFFSKEKDQGNYEALSSGSISPSDFILGKIADLELEPSDLALYPSSASAVITDPNNGNVLACVSYPGYDSNRLSNNMDTDYYTNLSLNGSSPFFNKATMQKTAPGSIIKPLSAIAGLNEGVITKDTIINCTGVFDKVFPHIMCWNHNGHGPLNVVSAIGKSCNVFFNTVGYDLGQVGEDKFSEEKSLATLEKYAHMIGLDRNTGIQLDEAKPHVSDKLAVPSYMGQGTHLYTTTEIARYVSVLANSGKVYNLNILNNVTSPNGKVIKEYKPEMVSEMDIPSNIWDSIHEGMRLVVSSNPTFSDLPIELSGKTGTAQVDKYHPDNVVFIGFAPSTNPQFAIAVRIANGYNSGNCSYIADDICNYLFNTPKGKTIVNGKAIVESSNVHND